MRRVLGAFLIAGLLFGAAACGSSGGSDSSKSDTTEKSSDSGSGSGSGETTDSSNKDVKAYCDAVDEYVKKAKDAMNDPAKAQALTDEAKDLTDKATALASAGLDSADAQKVADCTKKSTDALLPS